MKKQEVLKLRNGSEDELNSKILDLKKELMNLRFSQSAGQVTNFRSIREVKKNIARVNTLLKEKKESGSEGKAKAKKAKTTKEKAK
jgi:large subunit ribosomal protein L29